MNGCGLKSPAGTIVAYGEVLWDLLPGGAVLGGAPFNFACRIGTFGFTARMASRLGRDAYGDRALAEGERLGLDMSLVQRDSERPTGTVNVILDGDGVPDFTIITDVAYDHIKAEDAILAAASHAGCICFGTLIQRAERSRGTLAAMLAAAPLSCLRFLDINLRKSCFSRKTVDSSLDHADILKLNEVEIAVVAGMFGYPQEIRPFVETVIAKRELSACVVTFGAKGAFAMSGNGEQVYSPGFEVTVVDTVGSGDAFSAGFVSRILRKDSLAEACETGNVLGALAATKHGATSPVTWDEMDRLHESLANRIVHPAFPL